MDGNSQKSRIISLLCKIVFYTLLPEICIITISAYAYLDVAAYLCGILDFLEMKNAQ